jgi:FkbM family methyltransferase
MRSWVRQTARKYGYEIRKAPFPNFRSVSVFELAIHYLIAKHGEKLTFIEVGANDGKMGEALREFILKYHWKGILIEPQPDVFERLKANYAGLDDEFSFENVAISSNPAPIQMYRSPTQKGDQGSNTLATADQKIAAKTLGLKSDELEKITVPTARLDDIVEKHGVTSLDILQIDTEGLDWDVLQTLDLTKTRPYLIRFEHGHLSPAVIGKMTEYLNEHGYPVNFGGYQEDSVALRNDFFQV